MDVTEYMDMMLDEDREVRSTLAAKRRLWWDKTIEGHSNGIWLDVESSRENYGTAPRDPDAGDVILPDWEASVRDRLSFTIYGPAFGGKILDEDGDGHTGFSNIVAGILLRLFTALALQVIDVALGNMWNELCAQMHGAHAKFEGDPEGREAYINGIETQAADFLRRHVIPDFDKLAAEAFAVTEMADLMQSDQCPVSARLVPRLSPAVRMHDQPAPAEVHAANLPGAQAVGGEATKATDGRGGPRGCPSQAGDRPQDSD